MLPLSVPAEPRSPAVSQLAAESAAASVWHHPVAPEAAGSSLRSVGEQDGR